MTDLIYRIETAPEPSREIVRRSDGYRFVLVASHLGTAPPDTEPKKADNCAGCGTKRMPKP